MIRYLQIHDVIWLPVDGFLLLNKFEYLGAFSKQACTVRICHGDSLQPRPHASPSDIEISPGLTTANPLFHSREQTLIANIPVPKFASWNVNRHCVRLRELGNLRSHMQSGW